MRAVRFSSSSFAALPRLPARHALAEEPRARLRGRERAADVWALRDVSFTVEPGSGARARRPQRLRQEHAAPHHRRDHQADRPAAWTSAGASARCSSSAPASTPISPGRENVFLNGSILGLKRAYIRERFDEIVAFAELERLHRRARAHLLVGDVHAARLRGRVASRTRTSCCSTRCSPSATQRSSASASTRSSTSSGTAARSCSCRTTLRPSSSCASERSCCARARVAFDGATHDALTEYHSLLADERDPAELAAGLSEWGSGEARIAEVRVRGADGAEREQFLSGEPFSLAITLVASSPVPPPRLSYELRDESDRLLAGGGLDVDDVGWPDGPGERLRALRPGRAAARQRPFPLLSRARRPRNGHLYHRLERVAPFVVDPPRGERGRGRARRALVGRGSRRACRTEGVMSSRTCPDWPRLMEIAPELQFKHYTVAEAKLPGRRARARHGRLALGRRPLLRPRASRLLRGAHGSGRRRGAAPDALVRARRVVDERPGRALSVQA